MSTASGDGGAEIDQVNIQLWSHGVVATDPPAEYPELATTPEWRQAMVVAREKRALTQTQLGSSVGTSQNIISLIESGGIGSSTFILPICRKLKIAPPQFYESDEQRLWAELGYLLQTKSKKQFRRAIALVEAIVEDTDDAASGTDRVATLGDTARKPSE